MSDANITTNVHDFVASGPKIIPPAHKLEFPPNILEMTGVDDYSRHFATNSMLVPLAFSAVSQLNFKLNIMNRALQTAAFFGGEQTDAFQQIREDETAGRDADERSEELGFTSLERATPASIYLYMRLGKEQAVNAYQLYGGRYMPFDIPSAIDFLGTLEPRAQNESKLKKETSAFINKELASLGIDPAELEKDKVAIETANAERDKETLLGNKAKIVEAAGEFRKCEESNEELWKQVPLATQFKCALKVYDSLKKSLARKVVRIEANPSAESTAQMDNEKNPVALAMRSILEDLHAVHNANKQLFDQIRERDAGFPDLPALQSIQQLTAKYAA